MIKLKCGRVFLNPIYEINKFNKMSCRNNSVINCYSIGRTVLRNQPVHSNINRSQCKMQLFVNNNNNNVCSSWKYCNLLTSAFSRSLVLFDSCRLICRKCISSSSSALLTTSRRQFKYVLYNNNSSRNVFFGFNLFNRSTSGFKSFNNPFLRINRCFHSSRCNFNKKNIKGNLIYSAKNHNLQKNLQTNVGKEMRRLFQLAKPEKWKLTGAIFLLLISSCITMVIPFSLGKVIDLIYAADSTDMKSNLNKLSIVLFSIFVLGGLCNFGRVYLMNVCGHRITKDLRQKVFSSVIKQETAFFDKNKTGELINRLSADTSLVGQCVTMNISDGLRSAVMAGAGISMMFYVSSELACVGLAIVPPVAVLAIVYGRFVRKITKAVQDALAESTQVAEERISNVRTVKSFSHEKLEISTYNDRMENVFALAAKESLARGLFFGLTGFSGNVIILTVLYYGVSMVGQNQFTVGSLSAFLFYAAYVGISLSGLSSFYAEMNKGLGASTRLWEIIDRVPAILVAGGLKPTDSLKGDITFQNVVFAYPSRPDSTILNGLNLSIKSGSVTAVVGQSGSGKSTLASLIIRLYDPQSGVILVDGLPVSMYDPIWLRSHIGTVSQEPVLFSGTIRDNIAYGANDPSSVKMETVEMAAVEANAYNFITKDFPQSFDTRVGERGIMLSGGQKQRVAIARALVKNPKILLLDEATSALDAESEHLVQEALERIMKGRTVLTIAHRLSTIRNADQIAVLKNGSVVELGTYNQLMSKEDGAFKKLIQHQTFHSANDQTSSMELPTLTPESTKQPNL